MSRERLRRPKLERTQPLRNWSTLFQVPPSGTSRADASPKPVAGDEPPTSVNDVVSRSVDLGYRVIDEYIRQGQKAAQRLSERSYSPAAMTNDLQEFGMRFAQYASDFAGLWFEFIQLAATGGAERWPAPSSESVGASALQRASSAAPASRTSRTPPPESDTADLTRVRIAVASLRPAEVSLDLRSPAPGRPLVVQALRSVDPEKPRLTDVVFEGANGDEPPTLRIRVPADQPPGVYSGVIIDADTSRLVGTLSLRVLPE